MKQSTPFSPSSDREPLLGGSDAYVGNIDDRNESLRTVDTFASGEDEQVYRTIHLKPPSDNENDIEFNLDGNSFVLVGNKKYQPKKKTRLNHTWHYIMPLVISALVTGGLLFLIMVTGSYGAALSANFTSLFQVSGIYIYTTAASITAALATWLVGLLDAKHTWRWSKEHPFLATLRFILFPAAILLGPAVMFTAHFGNLASQMTSIIQVYTSAIYLGLQVGLASTLVSIPVVAWIGECITWAIWGKAKVGDDAGDFWLKLVASYIDEKKLKWGNQKLSISELLKNYTDKFNGERAPDREGTGLSPRGLSRMTGPNSSSQPNLQKSPLTLDGDSASSVDKIAAILSSNVSSEHTRYDTMSQGGLNVSRGNPPPSYPPPPTPSDFQTGVGAVGQQPSVWPQQQLPTRSHGLGLGAIHGRGYQGLPVGQQSSQVPYGGVGAGFWQPPHSYDSAPPPSQAFGAFGVGAWGSEDYNGRKSEEEERHQALQLGEAAAHPAHLGYHLGQDSANLHLGGDHSHLGAHPPFDTSHAHLDPSHLHFSPGHMPL